MKMDAEARAASERIERLLAEVRATAGPVALPRVEALVQSLVELYGQALARLATLVESGGGMTDELRARLAGDELVASLLALHGVHPFPAEQRISARLAEAASEVGTVELVAVEEGVARLRVLGSARRVAPGPLGAVLQQLVEEVAPELRSVRIEGLPDEKLLQIDLSRTRARSGG
jgi:hypothetical protein